MTIDIDLLLYKFKNLKRIINIHITKCYKLLFSKSGLIPNIVSYILLVLILIILILIIVFYADDYKKYKRKVEKILEKGRTL